MSVEQEKTFIRCQFLKNCKIKKKKKRVLITSHDLLNSEQVVIYLEIDTRNIVASLDFISTNILSEFKQKVNKSMTVLVVHSIIKS